MRALATGVGVVLVVVGDEDGLDFGDGDWLGVGGGLWGECSGAAVWCALPGEVPGDVGGEGPVAGAGCVVVGEGAVGVLLVVGEVVVVGGGVVGAAVDCLVVGSGVGGVGGGGGELGLVAEDGWGGCGGGLPGVVVDPEPGGELGDDWLVGGAGWCGGGGWCWECELGGGGGDEPVGEVLGWGVVGGPGGVDAGAVGEGVEGACVSGGGAEYGVPGFVGVGVGWWCCSGPGGEVLFFLEGCPLAPCAFGDPFGYELLADVDSFVLGLCC